MHALAATSLFAVANVENRNAAFNECDCEASAVGRRCYLGDRIFEIARPVDGERRDGRMTAYVKHAAKLSLSAVRSRSRPMKISCDARSSPLFQARST